jgi:hypothetical protein
MLGKSWSCGKANDALNTNSPRSHYPSPPADRCCPAITVLGFRPFDLALPIDTLTS